MKTDIEEMIEDYREKFLSASGKLDEDGIQLYCSRCFDDDSFYDWLRDTLTTLTDKVREEARQAGYADGYKQGKFDAEVTAEYGEPKAQQDKK